jgi:hypothetical protein
MLHLDRLPCPFSGSVTPVVAPGCSRNEHCFSDHLLTVLPSLQCTAVSPAEPRLHRSSRRSRTTLGPHLQNPGARLVAFELGLLARKERCPSRGPSLFSMSSGHIESTFRFQNLPQPEYSLVLGRIGTRCCCVIHWRRYSPEPVRIRRRIELPSTSR